MKQAMYTLYLAHPLVAESMPMLSRSMQLGSESPLLTVGPQCMYLPLVSHSELPHYQMGCVQVIPIVLNNVLALNCTEIGNFIIISCPQFIMHCDLL